jgi:hypothetical protein
MSEPPETWVRVAQVSSALGLGTMTALIYSLRSVNPQVVLEGSVGSLVAFAGGAALAWMFWESLLRPAGSNTGRVTLSLAMAITLLTLGGFAFAMKDLKSTRFYEVVQGTLLAFALLSVLGFVLWKLIRFLEQDSNSAVRPESTPDSKRPDDPP